MLPCDPEIERTLKNRRRSNRQELNMDENQGERNSDAYSDRNEMQNFIEPTLVDCWKPMMIDNYSRSRQQCQCKQF